MPTTENKSLDGLANNALVIVRDMKPQSQDKSLKTVPFKITKGAFLKLQQNTPGRYQLESVYSSGTKAQQRQPSAQTQKSKPSVSEVDESGLEDTEKKLLLSKDANATDAVAHINTLKTAVEIKAYTLGEDREIIKQAANEQQVILRPSNKR